METPVTSLSNIGKDTAAKLEKIGIRTAEEFLARDPYLVFEKLRKNFLFSRCGKFPLSALNPPS